MEEGDAAVCGGDAAELGDDEAVVDGDEDDKSEHGEDGVGSSWDLEIGVEEMSVGLKGLEDDVLSLLGHGYGVCDG